MSRRAVVPVRDGRLPKGAADAVALADGEVILVGEGTRDAAEVLRARTTWCLEAAFAPGRLAAGLAPHLDDVDVVIVPASLDGRDLAPRLAAQMDRPLWARATELDDHQALLARIDDRVVVPVRLDGPCVVTVLLQGRAHTGSGGPVHELLPVADTGLEASQLSVSEPDVRDLAEAPRVLAGGAGLVQGLDDHEARQVFALLERVGEALGAAMGATRVATDAGWVSYDRQIGTTGVVIDPDLYVAFGISGAAQHVDGLGTPKHIVSINLDASCPMTARSDLGLVSDARALLVALAQRLGVES